MMEFEKSQYLNSSYIIRDTTKRYDIKLFITKRSTKWNR